VAHGMHRKDSPQDIVIFGVIGVTLLALLPSKQPYIQPRELARSPESLPLGTRAAVDQVL
jgi:hypothetical protein